MTSTQKRLWSPQSDDAVADRDPADRFGNQADSEPHLAGTPAMPGQRAQGLLALSESVGVDQRQHAPVTLLGLPQGHLSDSDSRPAILFERPLDALDHDVRPEPRHHRMQGRSLILTTRLGDPFIEPFQR